MCRNLRVLVCALLAVAGSASAQNIWVGKVNSGTSFNFSPNFINNELTNVGQTSSLAFYTHTNGDTGLAAWDLILAFVNGTNISGTVTAPAAPTITSVAAYSNVGNVNGSGNITLTSAHTPTPTSISMSATATMTASNSNGKNQDAYTVLGLPNGQGSPSENWTNYSGADAAAGVGIIASSFTLYEYNLSAYASTLGNYGLLNLTFSGGGLPDGAIAIGFGCSTSTCGKHDTQDNSIFTQSGIVDTPGTQAAVPEPASVILLGTVSAVVLLAWKRKNRRNPAA